ncbi:hypothetical protein [Arthrobacter psychrolactophilus]|nr:hypothetical protein [Arthrobacter psychrolactophilus]
MSVFPFPIIGIDSDNGSEFINDHLCNYCKEHQITFTRSRPYNKNDGAHVEQKNWARVRELVGCLRYDTPQELPKLNEIWELDRVFTNYLLPQQKLISKQRYGSKVIKHYDVPASHPRPHGAKEAERHLQTHQASPAPTRNPPPDRRTGKALPSQENPAGQPPVKNSWNKNH